MLQGLERSESTPAHACMVLRQSQQYILEETSIQYDWLTLIQVHLLLYGTHST